MLSFQSRFSIIELLTLTVIAMILLLAFRSKKLRENEQSIFKKMEEINLPENEEYKSLEKQQNENYKKLNQIYKFFVNIGIDFENRDQMINYFGVLPILLLVTFIHQIYLFF